MAIRCGVDCWLGRGCDPVTGRWLEAFALYSVVIGGRGSAVCDGALTGLRTTLLSADFLVDWACELHERELVAVAALLRAVCAADASLLTYGDETQDANGVDALHEGQQVVQMIRNAVRTV